MVLKKYKIPVNKNHISLSLSPNYSLEKCHYWITKTWKIKILSRWDTQIKLIDDLIIC